MDQKEKIDIINKSNKYIRLDLREEDINMTCLLIWSNCITLV